jgi:hypothetical protein
MRRPRATRETRRDCEPWSPGRGVRGVGGLSLPLGTVAQIGVFPLDDAGDVDDASVLVRADDSTEVVVASMTTPYQYVLIGANPGDTTIRFFMKGRQTTALTVAGNPATALSVQVTPQSDADF